MSHYISITAGERAEMLKAIGVDNVAALFDAIPSAVRFPPLNLPKALSEPEIRRELTRLSNQTAGAHTIVTEAPIRTNGVHMMGTARMGLDPTRSVVNEWGRSHDVKNLFVVDGSIFVTSAGLNPTRTIQALSLYICDQMKQRLATLFD